MIRNRRSGGGVGTITNNLILNTCCLSDTIGIDISKVYQHECRHITEMSTTIKVLMFCSCNPNYQNISAISTSYKEIDIYVFICQHRESRIANQFYGWLNRPQFRHESSSNAVRSGGDHK